MITYGSRTGDFAVKTAPPGVSFDAIPGPVSYDVVRAAGGADTVLPPDFRPPPELTGNRDPDLTDPELHSDRDPRDPRDDPRAQRRRVIPECR